MDTLVPDLAPAHLCAMVAPIWRSIRTGAPGRSAKRRNKATRHLRATCPGCKRIADVPWPLLLGRKGTNRETFLGNIPLRCQRCGNAAPIIGVRQNNTAEPRTGTASAGALVPTAIPATPTDRIDGCP